MVVKSQTYRPSVSADVTVSVNVIEQVPAVALTIAVVNDVALLDKCVFLNQNYRQKLKGEYNDIPKDNKNIIA